MDFFDIFQLFYLILFLGIFIGRSVYLSRKGIHVFVIGKGKTKATNFLEISFILILFLWIYSIVSLALFSDIALLPDFLGKAYFSNSISGWAGIILLLIGIAMFIWALISFSTSWRIGIDNKQADRLITTGAFAVSRNPIFLFINFYFIGTAMIYPNFFFILMSIAALIGIHKHILNEEKFLDSHYKDEYRAYFKKVRRYF